MKAQNLNSYPVDIPEGTVLYRETVEVDKLYPGLTALVEAPDVTEGKPSKTTEKGKA